MTQFEPTKMWLDWSSSSQKFEPTQPNPTQLNLIGLDPNLLHIWTNPTHTHPLNLNFIIIF